MKNIFILFLIVFAVTTYGMSKKKKEVKFCGSCQGIIYQTNCNFCLNNETFVHSEYLDPCIPD